MTMAKKRRQLITVDRAIPSKGVQHTKPCSDCPFARGALPGWLGGSTPEEYRRLAHADTIVDCHAIRKTQCAGLAIYRANVVKRPPEGALVLSADREAVFATPMEFVAHHQRENLKPFLEARTAKAGKR
jgi:hypothetical protein